MISRPWPQADSLFKVVSICEYLPCTKKEIIESLSLNFGLSERQCSYYISAALWVGLVQIEDGLYYSQSSHDDPYEFITEVLKKNRVFSAAIEQLNQKGTIKSQSVIENLLLYSNLKSQVNSTHKRRARTVISWVTTLKDKGYV